MASEIVTKNGLTAVESLYNVFYYVDIVESLRVFDIA